MKRRKRKPEPGYLVMPHGPTPWHFTHQRLHGNGFNGKITHLWQHPNAMAIPGKGIVGHGL